MKEVSLDTYTPIIMNAPIVTDGHYCRHLLSVQYIDEILDDQARQIGGGILRGRSPAVAQHVGDNESVSLVLEEGNLRPPVPRGARETVQKEKSRLVRISSRRGKVVVDKSAGDGGIFVEGGVHDDRWVFFFNPRVYMDLAIERNFEFQRSYDGRRSLSISAAPTLVLEPSEDRFPSIRGVEWRYFTGKLFRVVA